MCMVDDCEPCDLSNVKEMRSRKDRKCDECRGPILAGEIYTRAKFLYDGYWSSFAMCEACKIGPARWLTDQCGGYCFSGVGEDLYEHWEDRFGLGVSDAEIIGLGRLVIEMRWRGGRRRAQRATA